MLIQTLWYWFCFFVFFNSLFDLIKTKNKVFYTSSDEDFNSTIKISVCLKIDSTRFNCSDLKDEIFLICSKLRKYFEYVESKDQKSPKDIIEKSEELNVSNWFKIKNSDWKYNYLNLKHICTLYESNEDFKSKSEKGYLILKLYNEYHLTVRIFVYADLIARYQRYEYLMCENFKKCFYFTLALRVFRKVLLPLPYETDCSNYEGKFYFEKYELTNSKSNCLQECFKYRYRLPDFYYSKNDTKNLEFNKSDNYELLDTGFVEYCQNQCRKSTCSFKYSMLYELAYNEEQDYYVKFKISNSILLDEAVPFMSSFDFWRKFLGFISLFFEISILSLTLKSIKILKLKTNQTNNLRKKLIISIICILLWSFLVSSFFYGYSWAEFIYSQFNGTNSTSYFYVTQPRVPTNFAIAICKSVDRSYDSKDISVLNLGKPAECFNSTEYFKVRHGEYEENLNFLNERFFYRSFNGSYLEHCFSLDVFVEEPRYRSMLSLTSLHIKTNQSFDSIYLNQINKSFTKSSYKFEKNLELFYYERNFLIDCEDYGTTDESECDSQQYCIEKCYNENFLKDFNELPSDTLINLNDFGTHEQNLLKFNYDNSNDTILKICEQKFEKKDCKSVYFISNSKIDFNSDNEININLFFMAAKQGNIIEFTDFEMICSFITLSTIIMGLNWPKLSTTTIRLINFFLKPEDRFSCNNLIFLASFIGFVAHSIFIYEKTCLTDVQISPTVRYDFLNSNENIPDVVLCLEHNAKFEKNEIETGNLLFERTKWINEAYLFKQITYYDLNMTKKIWKPESNMTLSYKSLILDQNLEIRKFFLLNYKCISVSYRKFNNKHPKNYVINTILKIQFNSNLNHTHYLFSAKKTLLNDFSTSFLIDFKNATRAHFMRFEETYYNPYQILINPKLIFKSGYQIYERNSYITRLRNEFKDDVGRSSLSMVLFDAYYDLEIDKTGLFDQFYFQSIKPQEDSGYLDFNYERSFFETKIYSRPTNDSEEYSLSIDQIYATSTVKFSKDERLILNVLNSIFFWFNFYLFDFLELFSKIISFLCLFDPRKIRRKLIETKIKFDSFFIHRNNRTVPIYSLNNLNAQSSNRTDYESIEIIETSGC